MSFFSRLFTRKLTFIEYCKRDLSYPEVIHIFGAIRVMPDEGDSFDIYRHVIIDINTFSVTNGLQQRGNDLNLKSPFVQRALDHMSGVSGKKLSIETRSESEIEDEREEENEEPVTEFENLEDGCELPTAEQDASDSDTDLPKALPKTGIVFTKNKIGDRERFILQYRRSGAAIAQHQMAGMFDYFRFILRFPKQNRIFGTYRKENWIGTGGMAFYVLDATTGQMLHNDFIR